MLYLAVHAKGYGKFCLRFSYTVRSREPCKKDESNSLWYDGNLPGTVRVFGLVANIGDTQ